MTVFADSSAVVKLYVDEAGHRRVRQIAGPLVISTVTTVEVVAALWRKHRTGELSAADAATLSTAFAYDLGSAQEAPSNFIVTRITSAITATARLLCGPHGLRAYDAMQLASAHAVRQQDPTVSSFLTFDRHLAEAAAREGFHVLGD